MIIDAKALALDIFAQSSGLCYQIYFLVSEEHRLHFSRFSDFQENFKILAFICMFPSPSFFVTLNFDIISSLQKKEKPARMKKELLPLSFIQMYRSCYHFPHLLYHFKFPNFTSISWIKLNKECK